MQRILALCAPNAGVNHVGQFSDNGCLASDNDSTQCQHIGCYILGYRRNTQTFMDDADSYGFSRVQQVGHFQLSVDLTADIDGDITTEEILGTKSRRYQNRSESGSNACPGEKHHD